MSDLLATFRRRWMLIVATIALAVAASAAITYSMTPEYTSTSALVVSTSQNDAADAYQGSLLSAERVTSYAELATRQKLAVRVIDRLDIAMRPEDLSRNVSATVVPDTVVMELSVTDVQPRQAQMLAEAATQELVRLVSEVETTPGTRPPPIKLTIIDEASLPREPSSPRALRNLVLAALLGMVAGVLAALFRDRLDTRITTDDDVVAVVDRPVMAHIPYEPAAAKQPILTSLHTQSPRAEAIRILRTNLQFLDVENECRVLVVTSCGPEEGKTTTTTNLAVALAQAGHRTLLVEADLRRPRISSLLGLEGEVGLTTILVGRIGLSEAVQQYPPVPNLDVVTSGTLPPNPADLLQSKATSDLFAKARSAYDMVLVDAPPLPPVTDAALLTARADGALLILRHNRTTREQLQQAVERLDGVGGRLLGIVFNMVPESRGSAGHYRAPHRRRPDPDHRTDGGS